MFEAFLKTGPVKRKKSSQIVNVFICPFARKKAVWGTMFCVYSSWLFILPIDSAKILSTIAHLKRYKSLIYGGCDSHGGVGENA